MPWRKRHVYIYYWVKSRISVVTNMLSQGKPLPRTSMCNVLVLLASHQGNKADSANADIAQHKADVQR